MMRAADGNELPADDLTPHDVEQHIKRLVNRIAKGIGVFKNAYGLFLEADRVFDRAYAQAYLAAEGSIRDKEMIAKVETFDERTDRDIKEQAFKHADRLLKALELELRAYQSIGVSIRQAYAVAGRDI